MEGNVPELTEEFKLEAINKIKDGFGNMRFALDTLEKDIQSDDMRLQTNAVWISGEMLRIFSEFFTHVKNLEKAVVDVQEGIREVAESSETVSNGVDNG